MNHRYTTRGNVRIFWIAIVLIIFTSPSVLSSPGDTEGSTDITDAQVIEMLQKYGGFGPEQMDNEGKNPYYNESLMLETLNSNSKMKEQLKKMTREVNDYFYIVNTAIPAVDTSLVRQVDDTSDTGKVSDWICNSVDILGNVGVSSGPLDAACTIRGLIAKATEYQNTIRIPQIAEALYASFRDWRISGSDSFDSLDFAITSQNGAYHQYISIPEFGGMTNSTIRGIVEKRFEVRYEIETMLTAREKMKSKEKEVIQEIKKKYSSAFSEFVVSYTSLYESKNNGLAIVDEIDTEISKIQDEIQEAKTQILSICQQNQAQYSDNLKDIEALLQEVQSAEEKIKDESSDKTPPDKGLTDSIDQTIRNLNGKLSEFHSEISEEKECPLDCPNGSTRNKDTGECECGTGFFLNEKGVCESMCDEKTQAFDEKTGECVAKLCPDGSKLKSDGTCVECKTGYFKNKGGDCQLLCPDGTKPKDDGSCPVKCAAGFFENEAGECESMCDEQTQVFDPNTGECVDKLCPDGNPIPPGGCLPSCAKDEYYDPSVEKCVKKCTTGGFVYDKESDGCVPPDCGPKKYWNANAERCECKSEYDVDKSGNCVIPQDTPEPTPTPTYTQKPTYTQIQTPIKAQTQTSAVKPSAIQTPSKGGMVQGLSSIEVFGIALNYNSGDRLYHGTKDGDSIVFDASTFIIKDMTTGDEEQAGKSDILYPEIDIPTETSPDDSPGGAIRQNRDCGGKTTAACYVSKFTDPDWYEQYCNHCIDDETPYTSRQTSATSPAVSPGSPNPNTGGCKPDADGFCYSSTCSSKKQYTCCTKANEMLGTCCKKCAAGETGTGYSS